MDRLSSDTFPPAVGPRWVEFMQTVFPEFAQGQLGELLGRLTLRERQVLYLAAICELQSSEIGQILEIAPSTARVLLRTVRRKAQNPPAKATLSCHRTAA